MVGKAVVSIAFVTLRPDGLGGYRPRYIPGPRHRRLGFAGEDLRHPDGTWFTLDECARWSAAREKMVAETEAAKSPAARGKVRVAHGLLTLGQLAELWFREPRLTGEAVVEGKKTREPLKAHTVRFYRNAAARLEALDAGAIWQSPAAAISAKVLGDPARGVLHRIEVRHGLATARAVRAFLGALYGWAIGRNLASANPVRGLSERLPTPAPRVRYASPAEIDQLVRAADLLQLTLPDGRVRGFADVGDAILLGLWTGQRQGDRLLLEEGRVTAAGILFRQGKKHGQPLLIPEAPVLAARLAAARRRRASWRVNYPHVLLDELLRRPWSAERYRKAFAQVRVAATKGIRDAEGREILAPMASLVDFHDQDLRDTAVTWLALAGVDKIGISSITGHSPVSIDSILKHYLGLHPDLARSAIGKLVAWFDQQGESNG